MSRITLRSCWCDIVLNVHAPIEDKSDFTKVTFYKELEYVFDQFPKYHIKVFLGDFNAKVGGGEIFSKQELAMRVYTKLAMVMSLE
jgi:hydroxypyruvate isomerase